MIRVLLADDHPVYREGVSRVLASIPDIQPVGETSDAGEAVKLASQHRADVLLLDVTMPGPGFVAAIKAVRAQSPSTRVLVVSGHDEAEYAIPSLRAGASGYVMKNAQPLELVAAIRRVHARHRYVSPDVADLLAAGLGSDLAGNHPHHRLSPREMEVLGLMVRGRSLKEIAGQLGIHPKTVSSFRARILTKLGVSTNAELVRYALEHDLLPN